MFFLFVTLSVSECVRFNSTTDGNVEITESVFDGCNSTSRGGAVSLSAASLEAAINACTFLNCRSDDAGGAIYFDGFRLSVLWSSTFSCVAAWEGASLSAWGYASGAISSFSDGASVGGSCGENTFFLYAGSSSDGESAVERANVTGNTVTQWAAAVCFNDASAFRFQFCEIWSNEGSNCILFGPHTTHLIRCISVRSNVADDRGASYRGLFFAAQSVTISDSAIAGNNATLLVQSENSSVFVHIIFRAVISTLSSRPRRLLLFFSTVKLFH
jgi:hypothetical protein